jgi:sortase (surface protein transpeptidase)
MRIGRASTDELLGARRRTITFVIIALALLATGLVASVIAVDDDGGSSFVAARLAPQAPQAPEAAPEEAHTREEGADAAAESVASIPAVPRGEPDRVLIPAIGVDVALVPLGLRTDRAMEVPEFGSAGWYAEGPRPGHPGPAVLAGHVDSWSGPGVFYRLRDLVAGDRVHVEYDSGDLVTFVVVRSEQTQKDALPVASIWPLTNDRLLALITCGGRFDRTARSYRDNVIVYATPLGLGASDVGAGGSTGAP